jgi:hypothetical protein
MHKYHELKLPPGMALQLFSGANYQILYAEKDIVKLRDWAADLTNELTQLAVNHLDAERREKLREKAERTEKIKMLQQDTDPRIDKELARLNGAEFARMALKPLTAELPPRIVNTDQGRLEVAGDVSDDHIREMGYTIIPENTEANGADNAPAK